MSPPRNHYRPPRNHGRPPALRYPPPRCPTHPPPPVTRVAPMAALETFSSRTPPLPRSHPTSHTIRPPVSHSPPCMQITTSYLYIVFRYIKFMISQDSYYLGEATLNHYWLHSGGFSTVPFSVPPNPQTHNPEWWYAVTHGRAVGIFPTW